MRTKHKGFLIAPRLFCCAARVRKHKHRESTPVSKSLVVGYGTWESHPCLQTSVFPLYYSGAVPDDFKDLCQLWQSSTLSLLQEAWLNYSESHPCLGSTPLPRASANFRHGIMERALGQESGDQFSSTYIQGII